MPLALSGKQLELVLATDQELNEPPTFVFDYLPASRWTQAAGHFDSITAESKGAEAVAKIFDALRVGLRGWRNLKDANGNVIEYDPARLHEILTPEEAKELLRGMLAGA